MAKNRTLILMNEWLRRWKSPSPQPLYCPKCNSKKVGRRSRIRDRKPYVCSQCRYSFSLEELPGCRCSRPGDLLTCLDCQHYQNMMAYVERNQSRVANLSEAELDAIINDPSFYKRNTGQPQFPALQVERTYSNEVAQPSAWNIPSSSFVYQLSLFDETFAEVKKFNHNSKHDSQNLEQEG